MLQNCWVLENTHLVARKCHKYSRTLRVEEKHRVVAIDTEQKGKDRKPYKYLV